MGTVSIVMSIYNGSRYLANTMENLISQTYKDIEIICVDDGSTDDTYNILAGFAKRDTRIKILRKDNEGPGIARNTGMELAKGEYLIFLDSDDYFEKNMIEQFCKALKREDADMAICKARIYDMEYKRERSFPLAMNMDILGGKDFFYPEEYYDTLLQLTGGFAWNKMFRTDFLKNNSLEFGSAYLYEDMLLTAESLILARKIALVKDELIMYRKNSNMSLSAEKDDNWDDLIEIFYQIRRKLIQRNLYQKLEKTYLNRVADTLYTAFSDYKTERAFAGLYDYYKNNLKDKYIGKDKGFFYNQNAGELIELLNNSCTALDFLLSYKGIRLNKLEKDFDRLNRTKHWLFPFDKVPYQSKVILYGAGEMGQDYYLQIKKTNWCRIMQWIDREGKRYREKGFKVEDLEKMEITCADLIIVGISDRNAAKQVSVTLKDIGFNIRQIILPD